MEKKHDPYAIYGKINTPDASPCSGRATLDRFGKAFDIIVDIMSGGLAGRCDGALLKDMHPRRSDGASND